MPSVTRSVFAVCTSLLLATGAWAQPAQQALPSSTAVDRVFQINGVYRPADGRPAAAVETVTFSIYAEATDGTPLWQETQSLAVDTQGRYSALLGSTTDVGLPVELFASGAPRWLGLQFQRQGEAEQARTLATSVPYAMKAAKASDADTLGGRPASSYVLAPSAGGAAGSGAAGTADPVLRSPSPLTSGTIGRIGKFVTGIDLGDSVMTESAGRIGVGTTAPLDFLHTRFTDNSGAVTGYAVQNLGATGYSGMLFYDHLGALGQFQGFGNGTHEYRINNIATGGTINFMVGSASKFAVANNSNIGLGTTAPQAALHIATRTNLLDDVGTIIRPTTAAIKFANNPGGGGGDVSYIAQVVKSGEATTLEIGNLNDTDDDITMRSSAGRVLFANAAVPAVSAGGTFSVGRTGSRGQAAGWIPPGANAEGGIFMEGSNTATGESGGFYADGNTAAIWSPGDADLLRVYDEDGLSAGQVGTPAFLVDGAGNIRVGIGTTGCVRDADLTILAGTCSSDERLKKDIRPFDGGMLERLLKLQPVYYHWREELLTSDALPKPGEAYGLIAQQVQKIYPEMVTTGSDGYLAVDYGKLQYVLVGALKEEHVKVEALDAKVNTLEKRLAKLESEGVAGWGSALWMVFAGFGAVAVAWVIALRGRRPTPFRSELPVELPVR